jgi:hypothetical protein
MPRTTLTPPSRPPTLARTRRTTKKVIFDKGMQLARVQERKRAAKETLRALDIEEQELCEQLAREGVEFGDTLAQGKVRIKRSWRESREELALTDARRQGVITPLIERALRPFLRRGDPFEVWEAKVQTKAAIPPESEAA